MNYLGSGVLRRTLRSSSRILATALIFYALPTVARADQMQTFDLTGTFYAQPNPAITGNFSASITIDTTTGIVTSISLTDGFVTVGGPCTFIPQCSPSPLPTDSLGGHVLFPHVLVGGIRLSILESSLVGVTSLTPTPGGFGLAPALSFDAFTTDLSVDPVCGSSSCDLETVTITPAVPEPATLWLLGTGIGLVLLLRKRNDI